MKKRILSILIVFVFLLTSCGQQNSNSTSGIGDAESSSYIQENKAVLSKPYVSRQLNNNALQNDYTMDNDLLLYKIYETSDSRYTIYTSELLDTYIIASALKLGFESDNLLPNKEQNPLFKKAEEYFSPYNDHEFIKGLDIYI